MADGRTVTIGGKQYLVTEAMAADLDKKEAEWEAERKKWTEKPVVQPAPKPVVPTSGNDDLDADKIFENPGQVLSKFGENLTQRIMSQLEEKSNAEKAAQRAEAVTNSFWVDFAAAHKDLKDDLSLAKTVLYDSRAQFERFKDKDDDQSRKECIDLLADLTRKEIQKYIVRQKVDSEQNTQSNHPYTEGAALRFGNAPPSTEGEKPSSLADIIKARNEARRKGKVA